MAVKKKTTKTTRKKESGAFDLQLLLLPMVLTGFGIIMVYSASMPYAQRVMGDPYYFLKRQLLWIALGGYGMFFFARCHYTVFQKRAYLFLGICLVLLVLVLVPGIGRTVKGARRWLGVGFLNLQPSEPAKLALIICLSHLLAKKKDIIKDFQYTFLPVLAVMGTFFVLVALQPDLGTAIVIACMGIALAFVAGVRIYYLFALVILSLPAIAAFISRHSYVQDRIRAFVNPWGDPLNTGFQTIQSFLAFGLGGWTGVGMGMGRQKGLYLPEPHNDFIFSVVGEEFGFLGGCAVLGLFFCLLWRIFRLMQSTNDHFAVYLVLGIGVMIALESLINIGVTLGVFPTKGLALPFLSYGGSAMVVNLSAMGMLISVSRTAPVKT